MRFKLPLLLLMGCTFTSTAQDSQTTLALTRIQYVYKTKLARGNAAWNTFGKEKYNVPLIYYAGNTTLVCNPKKRFLDKFHPQLLVETKNLKIYQLNYRLDSLPMHMETAISTGPDTTAYDYYSPYMKCSSPEEFIRVSGFKVNTQEWAAIVLHEFFHGFQIHHPAYVEQGAQNYFLNASVGKVMQQLYNTYDWYKTAVDRENNLLLEAITSKNTIHTDSLIAEFFRVRQQRRSMTTAGDGGPDLSQLEKSFETIEGTARFIEAFVITHPVADPTLKKIDSLYTNDPAPAAFPEDLVKTQKTQVYYYATGFNIVRLLQKLKIDYESKLYKQADLTLEDLLQAYLKR